ncbi:unnamed protein product [Calypogeia fissa]
MQEAKSLDCGKALRRLVARQPSVANDPQVARLLSTENHQEDADVLAAVQKLLLVPNLTVAVAGCFRPLLLRLVDGLVQSLRHLWLHGSRNSLDNSVAIFGFGKLTNWSISYHEYAVMAFSRLLELAPYTLSSVIQYYSFAPAPFERLLHSGGNLPADASPLLDVVRACYRYLQLEPKSFRDLWDWSPFLDLLCWTGPDDPGGSLSQAGRDVRWCAVQVLSLVLRMSDVTTRALSSTVSQLKEEDCFACLMRWEAFSQEISVEKAGMFLTHSTIVEDEVMETVEEIDSSKRNSLLLFEEFQSVVRWGGGEDSSYIEICGVQLPVRKDIHRRGSILPRSFVLTSTVKKNLESVVLALSQRQPILLEGPIGSGKSSLIQELANFTGNSDVIFIHLDDQMDSKMLLGNYVCTEIPGEFKWQPGALTQAVVQGMWVVFEDIDRAPFEILSALVPLLEDRKLYIAGRGEVIHAAENFCMFSTITRTKFGSGYRGSAGKDMLANLWRKVIVDAPSDEELAVIIEARFPMLSTLVPKLIGTLNMVREIASQSTFQADGLGAISVHIGRQFSTRDLVKWCKRVTTLGSQHFEGPYMTTYVRERIYVEAVDCFAGSISSIADRQLVMRAVAELWEIPLERVDFFWRMNKPSFQVSRSSIQVGRATMLTSTYQEKIHPTQVFAHTGHTMRMLESIALCVQQKEPVLLVGETGTGKTSLVQYLARQMSTPLVVLNLSQQSDSVDLLGGFKPVEAQSICVPLFETFSNLFRETFPRKKNAELLEQIGRLAGKKKWEKLLKAFRSTVGTVAKLVGSSFPLERHESRPMSNGTPSEDTSDQDVEDRSSKRKRQLSDRTLENWRTFSVQLHKAERQVESAKTAFAFSFMEGALVKALKEGHWILLDEVNLAPSETLERLTGVLEGEKGSLCLTERGDVESIKWHPDFRIFACMNPATDVGKRDLPISLKNRFTEFYVDELTNEEDLQVLVYQYLEAALPSPPVEDIVNFYLLARQEAEVRLLDGANQKPQYSLRSLARALEYTKAAMSVYGFQRALYDGICMSFLTLLDRPSALIMEQLILGTIFKQTGPAATKLLKSLLKVPSQPSSRHVLFEQFWVESGDSEPSESARETCERYVLTTSIREHLKNLARAVFVRKNPVLLQGPTSSGKTSMIEYLAIRTGHRFVRINNHEHTDLQEYLGSYVTDPTGKLVFQEGILVQAVRKGYWIVLDELNLAPSDVLEALNRLLDDNRELFVPELQVMIKPHPHFMLFATQNPPGVYGGRKILSRAFRNRFIELHVDDIPDGELQAILEKRCQIPGSYATKMVEVMKDLQRHRQGSKVFAGKHGFITPRDLFRWAERHGNGYEELAWDGYMLLGERLRNPEEKVVVQTTLERHMRVKIQPDQLHETSSSDKIKEIQELLSSPEYVSSFGKIVWTKSMKRLFNLVEHCVRHQEPVLLVGDTGCGKTTVCQMLALLLQQRLHIINCHQHSETADFLGSLRPVRDRDNVAAKYEAAIRRLSVSRLLSEVHDGELSCRVEDSASTLTILQQVLSQKKSGGSHSTVTEMQDVVELEGIVDELLDLQRQHQSLFLWHDGPLVEAMRDGDLLLIDEISLADDSVLERLNSVLEPKRLLVLAEKGSPVVEEVIAHPKFRILATMNPGGDFGKRELSPALRNRFTEIWVPPVKDIDDLQSIVADRFANPELLCLKDPLLEFWQWFQQHGEQGRLLSVRDLLSLVSFINITSNDIGQNNAFVHGALLVLLDGIGLGTGMSTAAAQELRSKCIEYLLQKLPEGERAAFYASFHLQGQTIEPKKIDSGFGTSTADMKEQDYSLSQERRFGIHPFYISKGKLEAQNMTFELAAPTTSSNALRILRAMQLSKPVLLEGSPGVGKTSLVSALALSSCHPLVRINLSEQTDVMDLFGSDMPVEGGKSGEFSWSDGVFLQALKAGHWVLLDELNLASQSVLEGLNSCLDHRGEVFIPELGRVFKCPESFRVFACQNPISQGGGRKGLPKSFLNRFTKVYVDTLQEDDFLFIARALHPSISEPLLQQMVHFNARLYEDTMVSHAFGHLGSPWEFNLRDILRWCELIEGVGEYFSQKQSLECFLDVVYLQRMRTKQDRHHVLRLYEEVFGNSAEIETYPLVSVDPQNLKVGRATLPRRHGAQLQRDTFTQIQLLPGLGNCLETLMHCVRKGWMCNLVGPAVSGKTSLVRLLAALTGNILHEFALSSATDTTELLGCFEQHDPFRHWQDIVKRADTSLESVCSFLLSDTMSSVPVDRKVELIKSLLSSWAAFLRCKSSNWASFNKDQESLDPLAVEMLLQTVELLEKTRMACSMGGMDPKLQPSHLLEDLKLVKETLDQVRNLGRFEWIDGGLLKALERGEWVLLENANLCNPTVLDRLNSLLEPNGTILINERGLVNGEAMVVSAHPNFRLFLTVDPSHGEVSRAMRNRGIEIFMMQPNWIDHESEERESWQLLSEGLNQDAHKLIVHAGIPCLSLTKAMFVAHKEIKSFTESLPGEMHVSMRELSHWISLLQQLLERGANLPWSLACSWVQTYVRHLDNVDAREGALNVFKSQVAGLDFLNPRIWEDSCLYLPGGWPQPHNLGLFCMNSKEASVKRDAMYLEVLIAQFFASKISQEWQSLVQGGADSEKRLLWLQSKRHTLTYFPAGLLEIFLNPSMVQLETSLTSISQVSMQDEEAKLRYSCLWMVERASFSDVRLRIQWLQNCAMNMDGQSQTIANIVSVLTKELDHVLAKQLFLAWEQLAAVTGRIIVAEQVQYASHGLVFSFKSINEENEVVKGAQNEAIVLAKKLLALRGSLLQWQLEDEVYKSVSTHRVGSSMSAALQSYLHHTNGALRQSSFSPQIPKTVLKYTYPLFNSMRNFENQLLIAANFHLWEGGVGKAFERLQEWHEALWNVLLSPTFNVEDFLFHWIETKRWLIVIIELVGDNGGAVKKVMGGLQGIIQVVDETFYLGQSSLSKPLLWKHGGHPQLLNSEELNKKELEVLRLCECLWEIVVREEGKQPFCTDVELRRSVMEGLSMSMWLRQTGLTKNAGNTQKASNSIPMPMHEAQYECGEIFKMLLQKLDKQNSVPKEIDEDSITFAEGMQGLVSKKFRLNRCKCTDQHQNEQLAIGSLTHLPTFRTIYLQLLPWLDHLSVVLDNELLAKISAASIDHLVAELLQAFRQQGLDSKSVSSALEFSLTSSSRSPVDFVPLQHALWMIGSVTSATPDVCVAPQHIIQEMWFRWHQALWTKSPHPVEQLSHSWAMTEGPPRLFQPIQSVFLSTKFADRGPVKEYPAKLTQLRISSMHMWNLQKRRFPDAAALDLCNFSLLFQHIILAHRKSFVAEDFAQIHRVLSALHKDVLQYDVQNDTDDDECTLRNREAFAELEALLRRSRHLGLVAILEFLVLPCTLLLYCTNWRILGGASTLWHHGHAWILVGLIRLQLLLPAADYDPVSKYAYKYKHASKRLTQMNLNIEVRQKSEIITRGSGKSSEISELQSKAAELNEELTALSLKVIPRPVPPKFKDFCRDVKRFTELSASPERLLNLWANLKEGNDGSAKMNAGSTIQEAVAWQGNSENFIRRLSRDFPAYRDFVQPVQQAIYELKFGLSLSVASNFQVQTLGNDVVKHDSKAVTDLICLLMEFPSRPPQSLLSDSGVPHGTGSPAAAKLMDNATERAVLWAASLETRGTVPEEVVQMEMKVKVVQIALLKAGQEVLQSHSITKTHLELLDSIFSSFSSLWSKVREYRVDQKRQKDELVKFSTSTHSMDVEATLDEEAFKTMFPDYQSDFDGFDDNMVGSAEEDDRRAEKANEESVNGDIVLVEKTWAMMEEALFKDVTHIHQSLFSPSNILRSLRKVSDEERLHSFTLSYNMGRQVLGVLGHCLSASVDEHLLSAHLMRSNLEYQNLTGGLQAEAFTPKADMYTDAHPSEIALMLDPVGGFVKRIADLLKDWPEHPILQQLLHISKTLLSFPLDTVVMKALTGVELLLSKSQRWEENAAKHVSIADELSNLTRLVTRWRKLELEGWATLLEKTERQHILSAQKLWFSLYDLLHRPVEDNVERYFESTISSIEEFMQTATFGEYRTRLQFVQAFYGHFSVQSQVKAPLRGLSMEVVKMLSYILYNVVKYYSQFLPTLDEILVAEKGAIEAELKEFVRLSKWDDRSHYTLTLSAEKSHRKLHKFVKKYNELLKRSASELLGKLSLKMGAQNLSHLASTVTIEDYSSPPTANGDLSQTEAGLSSKTTPPSKTRKKKKALEEKATKPLGLPAEEWKTRCGTKLVQLTELSNSISGFPKFVYLNRLPALTSKMIDLLDAAVFSEAGSNNRAQGTDSLEMLSSSIIVRASDLRNGEHKLAVKTRAFVDLIKTLPKIGLSHGKSAVPQRQRLPSSWLQLQPAEVGNMLLVHDGKESMADWQGYTNLYVLEGSASLWTKASDYYYKNMALLQQLQRSALDFNKDLSLKDVERTTKYTEHLLYLQQSQRSRAHEFSSKLSLLGQVIKTLSSGGKSIHVLPRQGFMRKWMWQQKLFFDSLQHVLAETLLLFKSSEGIQLCPANSMRVEAGSVKVLLQELLAGAEQCKSRLDSRLFPKGSCIALDDKDVSWPFLFTNTMLEDLATNFAFLNGTQDVFRKFFEEEKTSSTESLSGLRPLQQLLSEGYLMFKEFKMEELHFSQKAHDVDLSDLKSQFTHLYEKIITESQLAVQKVSKTQVGAGSLQPSLAEGEEEVLEWERIQTYEEAIVDQIASLRLTSIHQAVMKILSLCEKLIDNYSMEDAAFVMTMGRSLDCIHVPLEMIHAAGMRLLSDYISLHKSVTKLGYVLSNLFVSLYTEGFCNTKEEEGKEAANKFDEAEGTGMGEGEGKKDVSEQIEDEEQLMGGTEKEEDVLKNEAGKKADKGIEMEQDFSGDMMDLSEDEQEEEDGNDEEEEEKLESKMGEGEDDSEVVDEKLWNNDDEKDQEPDAKEKYEKDSAVSGVKPEDLEMRGKEDEAKDDDSARGEKDKDETLSKDETQNPSELLQEPEAGGEEDDDQDKKEEKFEEKSGVQPSKEDTLEFPENLDLDGGEDDDEQGKEQEQQQEESTTAGDEQEANTGTDDTDLPENMNLDDDNPEDPNEGSGVPNPNPGGPDTDDGADESSPEMEVDNEVSNKEPDVEDNEASHLDEASQLNKEVDGPAEDEDMEEPKEQAEDPSDPQDMDARTSGKGQEQKNVIAGTKGMASQLNNADDEVAKSGMVEALQEERSAAGMEQSSLELDGTNRTSFPEPSTSSTTDRQNLERPDINPYRSLGDALKHWKERINVVDAAEAPSAVDKSETQEEEELPSEEGEEDRMEYEYVTKEEQGTAQALGSATKEQLAESNDLEVVFEEENNTDDLMKSDTDIPDPMKDELADKVERTQVSANSKKHRNMKSEAGDEPDASGNEDVQRDIGLLGLEDATEPMNTAEESIVSLQRQHNGANPSSELKLLESAAETWSEEEISRVRKELETGLKETAGNLEAARLIWQKYEHLTARLSQELSEQLRMILEPTLAARLQGDYRTGKRINMKKIIPYIASSFRKDKIWLRRTKANKRQYQVVLAIDDSRSMSESHCGHLAVEALITICRAMSQLEIGQMAVASFGQKGNVHLLHDFDQPFSSEAGINMVSRFSFSQDNTIADQPMVDLLQFLTRMLDMAANHAAVPSGNVNLQQLVLIIADGRFHEKESLRRCIREATSRRQLLALIVLDNPQQSILDMQSVSFANRAPSFSKYLDSFPFPYYIVLRDIEALPRTLADLMRQWFELTQQSTSGQ